MKIIVFPSPFFFFSKLFSVHIYFQFVKYIYKKYKYEFTFIIYWLLTIKIGNNEIKMIVCF